MTERVRILAGQIRELSGDERAELLRHFGWLALDDGEPDGTPEEIESAWAEEIERRIAARERGEVELIPAEVVMAEMRARLRRPNGS